MPMPGMTQARPPEPSGAASVKMPQTLRPRTKMSFTHFMPAVSPETRSMACAAATADAGVMSLAAVSAGNLGRRSSEKYTPQPAGEKKRCSPLPRPAVCAPAMTAVNSGAPSRASAASTVFVESTLSYTRGKKALPRSAIYAFISSASTFSPLKKLRQLPDGVWSWQCDSNTRPADYKPNSIPFNKVERASSGFFTTFETSVGTAFL